MCIAADTAPRCAHTGRLNWQLHFGEAPKWAPGVKFILVDVAPSERDAAKAAVVLRGDAAAVAAQLERAIAKPGWDPRAQQPWRQQLASKVGLRATFAGDMTTLSVVASTGLWRMLPWLLHADNTAATVCRHWPSEASVVDLIPYLSLSLCATAVKGYGHEQPCCACPCRWARPGKNWRRGWQRRHSRWTTAQRCASCATRCRRCTRRPLLCRRAPTPWTTPGERLDPGFSILVLNPATQAIQRSSPWSPCLNCQHPAPAL